MYLAAVVLATLSATTLASERKNVDSPERQLKLSPYQDAWKSVENPAKRYQLYRSYKTDKVFGGSSKCMFIKQTKHNTSLKTAVTEMGYYDSTANKIVNFTACTRVVKTNPYAKENVIRAGPCGNLSRFADSPIIFSDYETCDVVRAPHTKNPFDCELWVAEDSITNVKSICEFAYDVFCNTTMKYYIFDGTCCDQIK
uniref:Putative salivary lipocalin n=1 Tax=Ixodes ricinus TaxID=34613 RepID=A0A0K8R8G4_IXORI